MGYWQSVKTSGKWFMRESFDTRSILKTLLKVRAYAQYTTGHMPKLWSSAKISSMQLFLVTFTTSSHRCHWATVYIRIEEPQTVEETKDSTHRSIRPVLQKTKQL